LRHDVGLLSSLRSQLALANARFEEARSDAMQAQDAAKQLIADKAALQTELDTIKANQCVIISCAGCCCCPWFTGSSLQG